jgi:hypothetical protein
MKNNVVEIVLLCALTVATNSYAYEIGNHASMSEVALRKSRLEPQNAPNKLAKLGLRQLLLDSTHQLFPRVDLPNAAPRKDCYGYRVENPTEPEANWVFIKEEAAAEPPELNDSAPENKSKYTLIDLIRLGACYENNNEANVFVQLGDRS